MRAFYRAEEGAVFLLPLGLLRLFMAGFSMNTNFGPFTPLLDSVVSDAADTPLAVIASLIALALAMAMAWLLIRALPMQSKPS